MDTLHWPWGAPNTDGPTNTCCSSQTSMNQEPDFRKVCSCGSPGWFQGSLHTTAVTVDWGGKRCSLPGLLPNPSLYSKEEQCPIGLAQTLLSVSADPLPVSLKRSQPHRLEPWSFCHIQMTFLATWSWLQDAHVPRVMWVVFTWTTHLFLGAAKHYLSVTYDSEYLLTVCISQL